jgi:hypothetical protein
MDKTLALQTADPGSRLAILETCEKKIADAIRRGMEAYITIGAELSKIERDRLWELRTPEGFENYCNVFSPWDYRAVREMQLCSATGKRLKEAGLPLPDEKSQLLELACLPEEHQAPLWDELLGYCRKNEWAVSFNRVKKSVEHKLNQLRALEDKKDKDKDEPLEISIDLNGANPPTFSDKGEEALERIERLCGKPVAAAIIEGAVEITEPQLMKWAQEEDHTVKTLTHYVINLGWQVSRALKYEQSVINDNTTLQQLTTMARARGGALSLQHAEFLLQFSLNKATQPL